MLPYFLNPLSSSSSRRSLGIKSTVINSGTGQGLPLVVQHQNQTEMFVKDWNCPLRTSSLVYPSGHMESETVGGKEPGYSRPHLAAMWELFQKHEVRVVVEQSVLIHKLFVYHVYILCYLARFGERSFSPAGVAVASAVRSVLPPGVCAFPWCVCVCRCCECLTHCVDIISGGTKLSVIKQIPLYRLHLQFPC